MRLTVIFTLPHIQASLLTLVQKAPFSDVLDALTDAGELRSASESVKRCGDATWKMSPTLCRACK